MSAKRNRRTILLSTVTAGAVALAVIMGVLLRSTLSSPTVQAAEAEDPTPLNLWALNTFNDHQDGCGGNTPLATAEPSIGVKELWCYEPGGRRSLWTKSQARDRTDQNPEITQISYPSGGSFIEQPVPDGTTFETKCFQRMTAACADMKTIGFLAREAQVADDTGNAGTSWIVYFDGDSLCLDMAGDLWRVKEDDTHHLLTHNFQLLPR